MEYNKMRELNVKEIQEVNGGVAPLVIIGAKLAGRALFGLGMALLTSKKAY
ncbi:class IIb bacteriocin, lactobin A/cerein 7B family [Pseudoalteromonas sp. JB197]|nr:class IIb bacteriocin, lactobin A/cerein 7B family [Pseudoalteromonas sp. JB197]